MSVEKMNCNYNIRIADVKNMEISHTKLYDLFDTTIGKVSRMDFVEEEWVKGIKNVAVFVKFDYWYENDYTVGLDNTFASSVSAKLCYYTHPVGNVDFYYVIYRNKKYDFPENENVKKCKFSGEGRNIYYTKNTSIIPLCMDNDDMRSDVITPKYVRSPLMDISIGYYS
jgi:hypothetical protein